MALIPTVLQDPLLKRSIFDEFLDPVVWSEWPVAELEHLRNQLLQRRSDKNIASISTDKDHFIANVDVQQFKPDEISVKVTGDHEITIEGKHEEKRDEHGYISRHFKRKYVFPKDCDMNNVQSKLSSDGVLTVTAPKIKEGKQMEYKEVPIKVTKKPFKKLIWKKKSQECCKNPSDCKKKDCSKKSQGVKQGKK